LADIFSKKTAEIFTPLADQIQQPNISPDNKLLFYRYLQIDTNVWLLDTTQNQ
jgi:hypothetical protein